MFASKAVKPTFYCGHQDGCDAFLSHDEPILHNGEMLGRASRTPRFLVIANVSVHVAQMHFGWCQKPFQKSTAVSPRNEFELNAFQTLEFDVVDHYWDDVALMDSSTTGSATHFRCYFHALPAPELSHLR